ncbi:MAG: DUF559 domain-containing protein [Caulobacteraceae bacterium]|nr:DUF559 domain-containing protein [Caulobacteraceae bacterium]
MSCAITALRGWKWTRQVPRGPYIVDFYRAEARVIVELDGSRRHDPSALAYDERRTTVLRSGGAQVIRIPNDEVFLKSRRRLSYDPDRLRRRG